MRSDGERAKVGLSVCLYVCLSSLYDRRRKTDEHAVCGRIVGGGNVFSRALVCVFGFSGMIVKWNSTLKYAVAMCAQRMECKAKVETRTLRNNQQPDGIST